MSEKKVLSAADILEASDIVREEVDVPEWGGTVILQSLSGEEVTRFIQNTEDGDRKDSSLRILVMSAVDEEGNKLFTEEAIKELRKKSFRAVMRLQEKALEINGMSGHSERVLKND